jgi:hypothetical protein
MKQHVRAFCTLALLAGSFPSVSAQGSQPSQPVDPTAQAPATRAPATPQTFPTSKTANTEYSQCGFKQRNPRMLAVQHGTFKSS